MEDELWEKTYREIKGLARQKLYNSGPVTLSPTELVHEVFLKVGPKGEALVNDESHFKALVAKAMRHVLIEQIRYKGAQRRGVFLKPATFHEDKEGSANPLMDLLALNQAIEYLATIDPRLVQIVECRYFGGLTMEETAQALGVSQRTVERDWTKAKLYLTRFLNDMAKEGDAES